MEEETCPWQNVRRIVRRGLPPKMGLERPVRTTVESRRRSQGHRIAQALDRVRQAANGGDAQAQKAIRDCVRNSPRICEEFGDATRHVEMLLIDLISNGEALTAAAVRTAGGRAETGAIRAKP